MRFESVSFAEAAPHLSVAMGDAALELEGQVARGGAECFRAGEAYLLMRLETLVTGQKELVLVAIEGRNVASLRHALVNLAKAAGAQTIRWHSATKLAAKERYFMRFFADLKPQLTEKIYKVQVS